MEFEILLCNYLLNNSMSPVRLKNYISFIEGSFDQIQFKQQNPVRDKLDAWRDIVSILWKKCFKAWFAMTYVSSIKILVTTN